MTVSSLLPAGYATSTYSSAELISYKIPSPLSLVKQVFKSLTAIRVSLVQPANAPKLMVLTGAVMDITLSPEQFINAPLSIATTFAPSSTFSR